MHYGNRKNPVSIGCGATDPSAATVLLRPRTATAAYDRAGLASAEVECVAMLMAAVEAGDPLAPWVAVRRGDVLCTVGVVDRFVFVCGAQCRTVRRKILRLPLASRGTSCPRSNAVRRASTPCGCGSWRPRWACQWLTCSPSRAARACRTSGAAGSRLSPDAFEAVQVGRRQVAVAPRIQMQNRCVGGREPVDVNVDEQLIVRSVQGVVEHRPM